MVVVVCMCVSHKSMFQITKVKLPLSTGGIEKKGKRCMYLRNSPSTASSMTRSSAVEILIFLRGPGVSY